MRDEVFADDGVGGLRFIGDFERLYESDPDPWEQGAQSGAMAAYYRRSRQRLADTIRRLPIDEGFCLEIGCGHGHALKYLVEQTRWLQWTGWDKSIIAIDQATKLHPHLAFSVHDIADRVAGALDLRVDVIVLNQMLWYVLDKLDTVVENCRDMLVYDGYLIISQAFLRGEQRYGADIADGFNGTVGLFLNRYPFLQLVDARYDFPTDLHHHDGLLVFRRR